MWSLQRETKLEDLTILTVGSPSLTLDLARAAIADSGAHVLSARTGVEAVRRYGARSLDLIVADLAGPDGAPEEVRLLRPQRLPARALAAGAPARLGEERLRAIVAGDIVDLATPVDPHELVHRIQALCRPV